MVNTSPPPPDRLPEEGRDTLPPRKRQPQPGGPLPPLWAVLLTVMLALLTAAGIIGGIIFLGGRSMPRDSPEAIIVITSAAPLPTAQQAASVPTPTSEITDTPADIPAARITLEGPTLVPTHTPTPTPIAITVGAQVIVVSQGGINVRAQPGTDGVVRDTANNNEVFTVLDGPEVVDGLRWWLLNDASGDRIGWVAENDGVADLIEVYVP